MNNIPKHVAIICDGNRRWARRRGLPTLIGHKKGFDAVKKIISHLRQKGVKTVTIWAFSTENWDRTKKEIAYLMRLFSRAVDDHLQEALEDKVKVVHIGRKDRLPKILAEKLKSIEEKTRHFKNHILNIGLDYGGRDEILRAAENLARSGLNGEALTDQYFSQFLDTNGQENPYPDLVVRTGGEMRLSGFMLWQIAYAELFFVKKGLPAMTTDDIDTVLTEYQLRQRRFGK